MTVAEENVSKNMVFWAFLGHFKSDLFPKSSKVIFMVCIGYEQAPPTVESIFRVVSSRFVTFQVISEPNLHKKWPKM